MKFIVLLSSSLSLVRHSVAQTIAAGNVATQNTSSSRACADVHLIVVRASTEKPGQGVIGTL
jgi:hypothetical protein